jgi:hypothetical protein
MNALGNRHRHTQRRLVPTRGPLVVRGLRLALLGMDWRSAMENMTRMLCVIKETREERQNANQVPEPAREEHVVAHRRVLDLLSGPSNINHRGTKGARWKIQRTSHPPSWRNP